MFLTIFQSCSTKKKAWTNRTYHNVTAKYNGYFNGKESLNLGVRKIENSFQDNYNYFLPIYKTRDLKKEKKNQSYFDKAIQKGSIVIQKHSIKINGREYCRWIDDNYFLIGVAYFYKGEFEEAATTFSFIKSEYLNSNRRVEASNWLARCYIELGRLDAAEAEIEELETKEQLKKKDQIQLSTIKADLYLKKGLERQALKELSMIDALQKKSSKKNRLNYIMGQLYKNNKDYFLSEEQFKKVVRSNADYEMIFNAKMNLATLTNLQNKDVQKMQKSLLKMTKDEKNIDYLDQIYYNLAEIFVSAGDTAEGIKTYILSTKQGGKNHAQKALSFLSLAELYYAENDYYTSKDYYDSTIYYMQDDYRGYSQVKQKQSLLSELVENLLTITLEDSLQALAQLSEEDLKNTIQEVINQKKAKERELLEKERRREQSFTTSNRYTERNEQFGRNTSGGNWYFYNPATLSFGQSEFRKKWGKRKLEDDWRRKDKNIMASFLDTDSSFIDTLNSNTDREQGGMAYYLEKIPKNEKDILSSSSKIKEALHKIGLIYREDLNKYKKSTQAFQEIITRFSEDKEYASLAYYNIYTNYLREDKKEQAKKTEENLLRSYPNSKYSKILLGKTGLEGEAEITYKNTYMLFKNKDFKAVIEQTNLIKADDYESKYIFLRGMSYLALEDTATAKQELQKIIDLKKDLLQSNEAERILSILKDPSRMLISNEQALTGSDYLFRATEPHLSIIILSREGVDVTFIKTLISDLNISAFPNEIYEISSMLMGSDKHLIMIKSFESAQASVNYNAILSKDLKIINELNRSSYRIMPITFENFKLFYKNQDMEGYFRFFTKNYNRNI